MGEHRQRDVKVVVRMRAPGQAPIAAGLRHPNRSGHGPEMRVGQRDVDRLQRQRVAELAPVGGHHVGRRRQSGGAAELGHHLAARETVFCAAGVFGIGHDAAQIAHQPDCVLEQPAAVRVQRHAGLRESLVQRVDCRDLFFGAQRAALQLEVIEAVALESGFGQAHHRRWRHRRFVAKTEPVAVAVICDAERAGDIAHIGQVGLAFVADEEQVAQHLDRVALLPLAQQRRHWHAQVLAQQVEQGRFDRCDRMDGGAQIEGLLPASARVAVGEAALHVLQQALLRAQWLADDQLACILQRLADLLAAGHFADASAPGAVGQDQKIAGEERTMRAAQVEQHAVAPGNRDHPQRGDGGGGGGGHHSHGIVWRSRRRLTIKRTPRNRLRRAAGGAPLRGSGAAATGVGEASLQ